MNPMSLPASSKNQMPTCSPSKTAFPFIRARTVNLVSTCSPRPGIASASVVVLSQVA